MAGIVADARWRAEDPDGWMSWFDDRFDDRVSTLRRAGQYYRAPTVYNPATRKDMCDEE